MLALLLALAPQATPAPDPQPWIPTLPDVVVFVLDDVAQNDVDLVPTPAIDALASVGTSFPGYSCPQCGPSRAGLMRGFWRGVTPGFACQDPGPTAATFPSTVDSLPKLMEGAGYSTVLVGRWGLGTFPFAEPGTEDWKWAPQLWGFGEWLAGVPDGVASCIAPPAVPGYSNWLRVDNGAVTVSTEYQTIALRDAFLGWWQSTPGPRCAIACLQAAHKGGPNDAFHIPPPGAMPPGYIAPPFFTDRQAFEAMVRSADFAVGEMMRVVDLSTTLVILVGDNGTPREVPPPGVPPSRVKFSTFQGGIRVPFVVAGLGLSTVRSSAQPACLVDIVPTLAELAGATPKHGNFDGQSLLPALEGVQLARGWVYSQKGDLDDHAVVEERWKLRVDGGNGIQKLYDLQADPGESMPIDPDAPGFEEIAARLRAELALARR